MSEKRIKISLIGKKANGKSFFFTRTLRTQTEEKNVIKRGAHKETMSLCLLSFKQKFILFNPISTTVNFISLLLALSRSAVFSRKSYFSSLQLY